MSLLDSRNVQTFQHATGVLYAIALDAENFEALVAAKAPPYLTRPLHQRCACESCESHHLTPLRFPRLLVRLCRPYGCGQYLLKNGSHGTTDATNSLGKPVRACSAVWSSPWSLRRSINLVYSVSRLLLPRAGGSSTSRWPRAASRKSQRRPQYGEGHCRWVTRSNETRVTPSLQAANLTSCNLARERMASRILPVENRISFSSVHLWVCDELYQPM